MPTRDSNISLNLTDDDEPAVQQQLGEETEQEDADTAELPEYVTPPNLPGDVSADNVPESPLAAAMNRFAQQIERPDEFTTTEREAIAVTRLHPDLSRSEVADRLDISSSSVGNAIRRADLAELSEPDEIHAAFRERTDRQQTIIEALVADPDCSPDHLGTLADCSSSGAESTKHTFAPLIHHLREVGFPNDYDLTVSDASAPTSPKTADTETTSSETFACDVCGKTFVTAQGRNGHTAVHSNEDTKEEPGDDSSPTSTTDIESTETEDGDASLSEDLADDIADLFATTTDNENNTAPTDEPTTHETEMVPRSDLQHLRQFVDGLRDAAATERSLTDDRVGQQSTAARQAVCEAVLTKIDKVLENTAPDG